MFTQEIKELEQQYNRYLVEEEDLKWKPDQVSTAQHLVISVQAQNEAFIPRQPIPEGLEWNQQSMTLTQVKILHESFNFSELCS